MTQVHHGVRVNHTVDWLFALPLCIMPEIAQLTALWIRVSIIQVCIRRSTSVSHSMARLPVWSLRVRAASMTQQLCISYPLVSLPFLLLCFLASRCGHVLDSFLLSFRMSENVVIRDALCMTSCLNVQPASELAKLGDLTIALSVSSFPTI